MEPPAVTSCSQQLSSANINNTNSLNDKIGHTMDRGATAAPPTTYQLQIDPNITFNSVNRPFEDLPENFLESISPQQTQGSSQQESPQLAPLAPMSLGTNESAYATLAPMSATPSYVGAMKIEPLQDSIHAPSLQHSNHPSGLDKLSFSSGPAGLLSPLQTTRSDNLICAGLLGVHQNGGRATEMLAGLRRHHPYIKEEVDLGQDYKTMDSAPFISHHQSHQSASLLSQEEQQQELDHRLANAETPPAVSNVELASSLIATMIGEQPNSPASQHIIFRTNRRNYSSVDSAEMRANDDLEVSAAGTSGDDMSFADDNGEPTSTARLNSTAGMPRASYSTKDTTDPLNAEIDDDIYIDTTDLCKRIAWELKQHSIPQAIFAERILCRSQGTLSDLLRNPKPWNKLKSGRETFRRMFNWVQQPLDARLGILDMCKGKGKDGGVSVGGGILPAMSPPTPAQNARQGARHKGRDGDGNSLSGAKRPRLVFTDIQKRTLQAIFKETQRPSREMQQTIAEHLQLDLSTVANFFMNARRRSRSGPLMGDAPAPYQQVRPITPPPESPPQHRNPNKARGNRHISRSDGENLSFASSSRIETTVAQVVEKAAEYARRYEEGSYPDNKSLKFRIGDEDNGVAEDDNSPSFDYEDQAPEYKMIRLSNDQALSIDSRQTATADELLAGDLPKDEAQLTCDANAGMHVVKARHDKDNVFVVALPSAESVVMAQQQQQQQQRQRSHAVMSFGNKLVTIKIEQRENPNSNSATAAAANSD